MRRRHVAPLLVLLLALAAAGCGDEPMTFEQKKELYDLLTEEFSTLQEARTAFIQELSADLFEDGDPDVFADAAEDALESADGAHEEVTEWIERHEPFAGDAPPDEATLALKLMHDGVEKLHAELDEAADAEDYEELPKHLDRASALSDAVVVIEKRYASLVFAEAAWQQ